MIGLATALLLPLGSPLSAQVQPLPSWCYEVDLKGTGKSPARSTGGVARLKDPRTALSLRDFVADEALKSYPTTIGQLLPKAIRQEAAQDRYEGEVRYTIALSERKRLAWDADAAGRITGVFYDEYILKTEEKTRFLAWRRTIDAKLGSPYYAEILPEKTGCMVNWTWSAGRYVGLFYIARRSANTLAAIRIAVDDHS